MDHGLQVADAVNQDDAWRQRLQRRTLAIVVVSQTLGGAGLAAGVTVGALLTQEMLGSDSLAGMAAALFTLGSAIAAFMIGRVTQRHGRRIGLALGFAAGGVGAAGVVVAAMVQNVTGLFAALLVYGAGTATNLQARYAGTDLAPASKRGTAISLAMVATTFGAVIGPNLNEPLGSLATVLGVTPLAGPYILAAVAYFAAGGTMLLLMRPDPYLVARQLLAPRVSVSDVKLTAKPQVGVRVGATVMVVTQITMIAIMTMTPVHMREQHHGLGEVGMVIGIHVAAMYLPSLFTGKLVDKLGRVWVASLSGITLLTAGVTAALAPGDSLLLLVIALGLLGLGWNFGLIAGTALVVDATAIENRPRVQGSMDVLVALGGAGAGAVSGLVASATDFQTLSLGGGVLALLIVPALLEARSGGRNPG